MTATGDPGLQVLDYVFQNMQIDERWSVREPRGFTWWGHRFAQRVWAEPARLSAGFNVCRVHAETALLRKIPNSDEVAQRVALINRIASLSGFIWEPERGHLSLRCGVYVHAENVGWLGSLFAAAVAIQAADAHIKADGFAKLIGGEPDVSVHPRSGRRRDMDEMLNVIEALFAPKGQSRSPWDEAEFAATLKMTPHPWVLATGGGAAMTAEFRFSDDVPAVLGGSGTALFTANGTERHPQLGSGALVRLSLPAPEDPSVRDPQRAARLASRLNLAEPHEWAMCHFLGGWCTDPNPGIGLSFVTFLPAAVYRPRLLDALVLSMAVRAKWAKAHLDQPR
jgi:hypothetical protein